MQFLRNAWYVAGWSDEVQDRPHSETIIGEHVMVYRDADGQVAALRDTCPHRFAPLSMGKIVGNLIECPYHGLRFNAFGQCVHNPFDPRVTPDAANIRTYPVIERNKIVWVWMGQKELADPDLIPDFSWIDETDSFTFTSFSKMTQPVNYELVLDNLMDLSHAQFIHPSTLGNDAMATGTVNTRATENEVISDCWNPGGVAPTLFVAGGAAQQGDFVDFWADIKWTAPTTYYLNTGVTPVGSSKEDGHYIHSAHLLTPRDEGHTVYRYLLGRTFGRENPELTAAMAAVVEKAFTEEDEPMITAVQSRMADRDFWDMNPVLLKSDKAAILVRRCMQKLVALDTVVA